MPADDHPFDALNRHYELEDSSISPVTKVVVDIASSIPLPPPFDKVLAWVKDHLAADSVEGSRNA
jgi:hypothetical protein